MSHYIVKLLLNYIRKKKRTSEVDRFVNSQETTFVNKTH